MSRLHDMTPGPWYYVTGAIWTSPGGPDDDDGQCIATRASRATLSPTAKDANLRAMSYTPRLIASVRDLLCRLDVLLQEEDARLVGSLRIVPHPEDLSVRWERERAEARVLLRELEDQEDPT